MKNTRQKTQSHGPPHAQQTFFISETWCRFHDWFLLGLEIVECLKYPLRSQQCQSSIKLSPTRLYVYLSQYLGLDKRPNDHFIPQSTYLTNLTICTWFTTVNDISQARAPHKKERSHLWMRYTNSLVFCSLSVVWLSNPGPAVAQPTLDMTKVKPRLNNCGISPTRIHDITNRRSFARQDDH